MWGMGNDCWRVPVSGSQSPDYGEWESPDGIPKPIVRKAAGWCNCLTMGIFGEREFLVVGCQIQDWEGPAPTANSNPPAPSTMSKTAAAAKAAALPSARTRDQSECPGSSNQLMWRRNNPALDHWIAQWRQNSDAANIGCNE